MPTKDEIRQEVESIANEGKEMKEKFIGMIEKNYRKVLEETEQVTDAAGQSTREMLNAVDEGLKGAGEKSEQLYEDAVDTMSRVAAEFSQRAVSTARDYADNARASFNESLEAAGGSIDEAQEATKEAMHSAYADLQKISGEQLDRMKEISDDIRDVTAEKSYKLSALARQAVKKHTHRLQDEAQSLEKSITDYSKNLLDDSRQTVADWLSDMADKIKTE